MNEESLHIEPGLRWYAIQTKANREKEVEKRLSDLHIEVFLPWMRTRRRIGSRFHWILAPLFPGYLFCRLDLIESGKAARYSPGVRDFLKFGNQIAEIAVEIVRTGSRGAYWLEPLVEVETPGARLGYGPIAPRDVAGLFACGFLDGGRHGRALGECRVGDDSHPARHDRPSAHVGDQSVKE